MECVLTQLALVYRIVLENFIFHADQVALCGRGSAVGIDLLRAGRSGDRIPVGARFPASVQTGPGACPASYTMGAEPLSRRVKWPRRAVDHAPPSSAEIKERVKLYLCSPSGIS
jgi:hypothetical protein